MIILNNKGNRQSKRASAKLRNFAGFVVAIFFVVMLLTAVGTSAWNIHLRADMDKSNLPNTLENAASNPYLLQYVDCDTEDTTTDILGADCPAFTYDNNQHTPFINNDKVTTDARKFSSELMAQFAYSYKRLAYPNTNFEDEGWFANEENLGNTAPKDAGLYQCTITNNDETYGANIGTAVVVFAIIPKNITLTIHPAVKIYGDVDLSSGASVNVGELTVTDEQNGIVDGASPLELSAFNYTASQQSPANVKAAPNMRAANIDVKNVGIYDIEGQDDSLNYNITYNACVVVDEQEQIVDDILATYTILPRDITITVNNATSVYGDAIATLTATANALVGSDSVADLVSLSTTATSASSIGTYPITATELTNEVSKNYNITIANQGEYTITTRPITVTTDDKSSVYGDTLATLTASVTTGSLVNGDTLESMFKLSTSATSSSSVGAYLITASAYVNDVTKNYAISIVNSGFYTITARAITVTVDDKSSVYGNTLATLTASVTTGSLVGSDSIASLVSLSTTATSSSSVGTYPITASTLSNEVSKNYDITIANQGTYTIGTRAITVTIDDKSSAYGNTLATLTASVPAGALVGSDSIASLVSLSTTATSSSNVGTYPITASTLTNDVSKNYNITIANQGTYTISARAITVTIHNKSSVYGNAIANLTASVTSGSLVGSDTVSSLVSLSTTATTSSNVGTYAITGTDISSNYSITFVNGTYTISARAITVTIDDKTKDYGAPVDSSLTASVTEGNLVNGNTLSSVVTISTTATASSNVGTYPITGTNNSTNYAITFVDGTYTINKTPLVLTLSNKTIVYNSALSFDTNDITIEGLTNSDGVNTIIDLIFANHHEISYFIDCSYRQGDNAGRSDGIIWTADGKTEIANVLTNYTPYFNNGTYTVVKASVDKPSADNTVFTYNGAEQTYTIASSSLYTVSGNKQTNAGNHTVTVTLNDAANYKWNGASGSTESAALTFAFNIAQFEINVANLKWVYDGSFDMPNNNQITYTGTEHVLTIFGLPNNVPAGFSVAYANNRLTDHQASDITATATFTFNANFKVFSGATTYTNTHQMSVVWNISSVPSVDKPTANSTVFTYNGTEQTYTLTTSSHYTITGDKRRDAGTQTVTVTLEDGYIWADDGTTTPLTFTFTINKKTIHVNTNAVLSASFDSTKRNFASVFGAMSVESGPLFVDDSNQDGIVSGDELNFSITSASTDGVSFNAISGNIVGTTYRVIVKNNDTNYNLTGNTQCLAKYKTALIGSTYYTIEDAIAQSGTISFAGDSTSASTYVTTTFSKFTSADYSVLTNYAANHTYTISGRTLIVPYTNSTTDKNLSGNKSSPTANVVYAAFTVPSSTTLNFTSSSTLTVAADIIYMQNTATTYPDKRGVLMNDGTLNFASGCKLNCYGYIKSSSATSNGIINLENGATATESMHIYDFPGGSAGSSMKSTYFPTNAWSIHSISCAVKINSGAVYNAFAYVVLSSSNVTASAAIIGASSTSNCMFAPQTNGDANSYIIKRAAPASTWTASSAGTTALYSVTGVNCTRGQRDIIEIYGKYNDKVLQIALKVTLVNVTMSTSTSLSAPLGFMDIIVKNGATVSLSKSDYVVMPGSHIEVEQGGSLTIGSDVDVAFLTMATLTTTIKNAVTDCNRYFANYCIDKVSAYASIGGTLTVNGKISGEIRASSSSAQITLANNTSATFTTMVSTSSPYGYKGAAGLVANGNINGSNSEFTRGTYYGAQNSSTHAYYWYSSTGDIVFHKNDGSANDTLKTIADTSMPYTLAVSDFNTLSATRQYYHYETDASGNIKWYKNAACTQPFNVGDSTYAGTHLYMKWIANTYTIHYSYIYSDGVTNADVGTAPSTTVSFNIENAPIALLDTATLNEGLADFTIYGWYSDSACTQKVSTTIEALQKNTFDASNNITVYAKWQHYVPSFTVAFANGTPSVANPSGVVYANETVYVSAQSSWRLPNNLKASTLQANYNNKSSENVYFAGWYLDSACTNSYADTGMTTAQEGQTITLYAKWMNKNSLAIYLGDTNLSALSEKYLYYIPGYTFTIPDITGYLPTNLELGMKENAYSYWLLLGGNDEQGVKYETGSTCTLNDATAVKFIFFNRYALTISNKNTTTTVTYTGYYSNSATGAVLEASAKTFTGNFWVFDTGTFTVSVSATGNNKNPSASVTGATGSSPYVVNGNDITITSTSESGGCFATGTLITLADGSMVAIEDMVGNEYILTFDHDAGTFVAMPFVSIERLGDNWYDVIHLEFADGSEQSFIWEHGLFDMTLNKYVYFNENHFAEYIGHEFAMANGDNFVGVELVNAYIKTEYTGCFSIYCLNHLANGMLSLPADLPGLFNIFEYGDNLKYDEQKKQQDIETYGLFTYEDFAPYTSELVFMVYHGDYLKVSIGKGLTTFEGILTLLDRYAEYLNVPTDNHDDAPLPHDELPFEETDIPDVIVVSPSTSSQDDEATSEPTD